MEIFLLLAFGVAVALAAFFLKPWRTQLESGVATAAVAVAFFGKVPGLALQLRQTRGISNH
jgi:hydrogenase-4 membrane subunit HyfE